MKLLLILCLVLQTGAAPGQPGLEYNRDILPILAEHCFACHGFDRNHRQGDLRLDVREDAVAIREREKPAIKPFEPEQSELVRRIDSVEAEIRMPPPGTDSTLTENQRNTLRKWIAEGAAYQQHWAYIAPRIAHQDSPCSPTGWIDHFSKGNSTVAPPKPAERNLLLRRLSLDLIGLPPTIEEIRGFGADTDPNAYERLVDRFLASPRFGEKWARWWLDMAHYADSDGYLQDFIRPHAWRYRQWVIDALNDDLPFDQFTTSQLAGDLLPQATEGDRIATGFLRNTLSNREGGADLEEYRVRQVVDRTVTTGLTWLGLTVGCAECHDHKFDPISQRDFYQLYAFFNNCDEVNFDAPPEAERQHFMRASQQYQTQRDALLQPVSAQLQRLEEDWEHHLLNALANPGQDHRWDRALEVLGLIWGQGNGEGQLEGLNIVKTPRRQRTADQSNRIMDYFLAQAPSEYSKALADLGIAEIQKGLDGLAKQLPNVSRPQAMEKSVSWRPTHIHHRGDFRRPMEAVQPNFLSCLPGLRSADAEPLDRLDLASWLVSNNNPLTARVLVNRIWQEFFGQGIVRTSDNFGVRGDRPTHPELLDYLAVELIRNRWSIKQIIRRIVLSDTYRQTDRASHMAEEQVDSRFPQQRIRLSAESVRDSTLFVGGLLDAEMGGPCVRPPQPESVAMEGFSNQWIAGEGGDRFRRSVYTFLQRTSPFAQSVTFDLPDSTRFCSRRERTNTPLQALSLLNDPTMVEAARMFGTRIRQAAEDADRRIEFAYLCALGRSPNNHELARLQRFVEEVQSQPSQAGESEDPWTLLASVIMNLDEFITRP